MTSRPSDPGICLVAAAEGGTEHAARIAAALDATQAATLILTAPEGRRIDPATARPLVEAARKRKIAALVADDVAAARATDADGVHLSWRPEIEDAYEAARAVLGADAIVGADAGDSRHDAMTLGESGADYVGFARASDAYGPDAARDTQRELIAWWAEVFVVPVVAFDVATPADVSDVVGLGADFVAVRLPPVADAGDAAAWGASIAAAVRTPAGAA